MDFTREPIIETVITPKEGCKLVVRSSKSSGQEEYFVDAVEVVSFGNAQFFRSLERPKAFLVPISDYEVMEVREARMVLKNVGIDRSIKIGGGREGSVRTPKEEIMEKPETESYPIELVTTATTEENSSSQAEARTEGKLDKKRDRRRHYRRRRGRDEREEGISPKESTATTEEEAIETPLAETPELRKPHEGEISTASVPSTSAILATLLPPPSTLISETIARYKDNALFKGAFFSKEEKEARDDEASEDAVETILESFEEKSKAESNELFDETPDHPTLPKQFHGREAEERQGEHHRLHDETPDDLWDFSEELPNGNQKED